MTEPDPPDEPSRHIVPPESVPPVSAEELVDGDRSDTETVEERRYPSTIGGAIYLVVLAEHLVTGAVAGVGSGVQVARGTGNIVVRGQSLKEGIGMGHVLRN